MEVVCAFVGEAGPAYGVKITESASVSALKVEIHTAYQNKLKDVGPGELQLFLAKRNDVWLTEAEVAKGVTDTTGLDPLDAVGAKLNQVGLSEEDVRFESTLEDVKVKNIPVHVLVEILEMQPRKKQRVGGDGSQQRLLDMIKLGQGLNLDTDLAAEALLKTPLKNFGVNLKRGLYVRQEYWDVYAILNKELAQEGIDRVLVIGSPGIGKSVFGVFLLLLFMSEHKNVAYRPLHQDKKLYYFTWDANKNCYEASMESVSGHCYEGLFDGNESGGAWVDDTVFVHSYLFASPRTQNYNEFVKEGCATIYMNPWTTRECKMYADKVELDDQNEWFMRYNLVGGKPRLLFSDSRRVDVDFLVDKVRTAIPKTIGELETVFESVQTGSDYDAIKHILFALFRDLDKPRGYFIHFASGIIDCMRGEDTSARDFLKTLPPAKMCVRPLERKGTPADSIQSLGPYKAKSKIFQGASEILAEERLYRPISKTFPSIDGVLVVPIEKRVIYLQTTVSLRHSLQHQALKDAIEILVGNGFEDYTHIFLFLVEADTYDQFRKQQFTNKNNEERQQGNKFGVVVTQYVGKIEKMKGNDDEAQEAQEAQEEDNDETGSAAPSPESHDASASEAGTKQRGGTKKKASAKRTRNVVRPTRTSSRPKKGTTTN